MEFNERRTKLVVIPIAALLNITNNTCTEQNIYLYSRVCSILKTCSPNKFNIELRYMVKVYLV